MRILLFAIGMLGCSGASIGQTQEQIQGPSSKYDATNINFGIGAMLPSNVPWKPLTVEQRKQLFFNDAFKNPRSLGGNFLWAVADMYQGEPAEWRQGAAGFGMRLASRYGRSFIGNAIQHGGAALLGTDLRYVRSRSKNPLKRMGNAVIWQFMTYDRNGRYTFDLPSVSAIYLQEIIGAQWMPNRTITGYALRSANQQMVQGIATNLFREFMPDLKRMFRKRSGGGVPPPSASPLPPPPSVPGTQSTPPASGAVPGQ